VFSVCIITLAFLLYGLHELPWSLFGSATGLILLTAAPFYSGMMLGYSFQSPKWALGYSVLVGLMSMALCFILMCLPYLFEVASYTPGFMGDAWFYGMVVPFILAITTVPAGAMAAVSTNAYD